MVPDVTSGIEQKHPKFLDNFEIAFSLSSWEQVDRVARAGLDANYNEFCRDREIKVHYGVYFQKERPK